MIRAEIVLYDQTCHIGQGKNDENLKLNCGNKISFDDEYLIIESFSNNGRIYNKQSVVVDLCAILFEITPSLIKELKAFVEVMDARCGDD